MSKLQSTILQYIKTFSSLTAVKCYSQTVRTVSLLFPFTYFLTIFIYRTKPPAWTLSSQALNWLLRLSHTWRCVDEHRDTLIIDIWLDKEYDIFRVVRTDSVWCRSLLEIIQYESHVCEENQVNPFNSITKLSGEKHLKLKETCSCESVNRLFHRDANSRKATLRYRECV